MFDSGKRRPTTTASSDGCDTVVGVGSRMKGEIICKGPSRIAGAVEGQLVGDARLLIAQEADIVGEISAAEIEIDGRVKGVINATERVILNETAVVEGDLNSPSVVIEQGAVFNGKSTMPSRSKQNASADAANVHALDIKAEKKAEKPASVQEDAKSA